jgi:hypothetical protein
MPGTKMLSFMNGDWPQLRDAGSNPICSFSLFGPYSAGANAPMLEVRGVLFVAAIVDNDAVFIA